MNSEQDAGKSVSFNKGSVGTVSTRYYTCPHPLLLESQEMLSPVTLAYETYGSLNDDRSNAILICHDLFGDAHAAGVHEGDNRAGWWDPVVGPGRAFDTDRFFVICTNVIGGCKGSTGPSSVNPETGRPYGLSFPVITIRDIVNAQKMCVGHLGIRQLFAVAGGSAGGLQALQWAVSFPDMVRKAIVIAASGYSSPQQIAFNELGRQAIVADPGWNGDKYYGQEPGGPAMHVRGLALARMAGHLTSLPEQALYERLGRPPAGEDRAVPGFSAGFSGDTQDTLQESPVADQFDATTYLYITNAIDRFDLRIRWSLSDGLQSATAEFLVISFTSDWQYPPGQIGITLTTFMVVSLQHEWYDRYPSCPCPVSCPCCRPCPGVRMRPSPAGRPENN